MGGGRAACGLGADAWARFVGSHVSLWYLRCLWVWHRAGGCVCSGPGSLEPSPRPLQPGRQAGRGCVAGAVRCPLSQRQLGMVGSISVPGQRSLSLWGAVLSLSPFSFKSWAVVLVVATRCQGSGLAWPPGLGVRGHVGGSGRRAMPGQLGAAWDPPARPTRGRGRAWPEAVAHGPLRPLPGPVLSPRRTRPRGSGRGSVAARGHPGALARESAAPRPCFLGPPPALPTALLSLSLPHLSPCAAGCSFGAPSSSQSR